MANRIKSISKYNGTAWGTETPIGADAANVDLATSYSATTATDANNATVETAMAAVQTDTTNLKKAGHGNGTVTNYDSTSSETSKMLTTDCVVAGTDDTAVAWSKFNRFRRRVSNKFADYFLKSSLVTDVTTTDSEARVYTTSAINQYLANVVGYTDATAPDAGTIAEQLESLNDNTIIRDEITITKTAEQASSWTFTDPADQTWLCVLKSGQSEISFYGSNWNGPYRIAKIVPSAGSASDWTIASNQLRASSTATISYPYSVDITLVNSSSTPVAVKAKVEELSDELQFSYANKKLQFGKLIMFFDGYTTNGTTQSYHFPSGTFPTACLAVIPYASHTGFGAASTISVWGITKDGFQYYSFTNPAANLGTRFVAIGY